mmetsp:Transcript_9211/g.10511  ORF Transcript_9211/g.10511 Transcript_9211/m.10511 type:complete len:388 (-) Transcript_9211:74-1237(-)
MDFLASIQLYDLPEQQTRAAHLSKHLSKDLDLRIGFSCCCTCGANPKKGQRLIDCPHCQRVSYCSNACLEEDAHPQIDETEGALGHSSIICSLLKLCNDDDDAEEGLISSKTDALDRLRTELESYPATLANILREAPCYRDLLTSLSGEEMRIHVLGASESSELWGGKDGMLEGYTEALVQLAEDFNITTIDLHMIGPDCPDLALDEDRNMEGFNLRLTTHNCLYTIDLASLISKPHAVVFFNPGFTFSDYDWVKTLQLFDHGTALLCTTNTEMEGVSDCNFLFDHKVLPHLPPLAAEIMGVESSSDCCSDNLTFFAENPYAGTRVRQSITMCNDLYVKNRWMLGGIIAQPNKRNIHHNDLIVDDVREYKTNKKSRGNTKLSNPSLI